MNWYINRILIKIYWYTINGIKFYAGTKQKIIDERLLPGQWLVERELGAEHGIRRTPLREALQRPVAEALLRVVRSNERLINDEFRNQRR
jgi:DNA-binding FadR family transcriptional regulator